MTPIQSQALDLLARVFIWSIRIFVTLFAVGIVAGIIGGFLTA